MHLIDHIIADKFLRTSVSGCGLTSNGTISLHTAVRLVLSVHYPKRIKSRKFKSIDWDLFTQDVVKMEYNDALSKLCIEHPPTSLELLS